MQSDTANKVQEAKVASTPVDERKQKEAKIEEILNSWWNEHVHGSFVAASSEGWNHLVKVFPILKNRLKSEI